MVRRLVFLLFVLVILAVTAAGIYLLVPLVGDLSEESLAHSVAREMERDDLDKARCRRQNENRYVCRVPGGSGKRAASYRVVMEDRRCWTANRTRGCVGLRDQLRLSPLEKLL